MFVTTLEKKMLKLGRDSLAFPVKKLFLFYALFTAVHCVDWWINDRVHIKTKDTATYR